MKKPLEQPPRDPELEPFTRLTEELMSSVSLLLREGSSPRLPKDSNPDPSVYRLVREVGRYDAVSKDDRAITAAVFDLHPFLAGNAVLLGEIDQIFGGEIHDKGSVGRRYAVGTMFPEYSPRKGGGPPGLHLILQGNVQLLAITKTKGTREVRREIAQYRTGQWMGFPYLLWLERERRKASQQPVSPVEWPRFDEVMLEAVASHDVRTQHIPEDKALALLEKYEHFRRFAMLQVLNRFARRQEIIRLFQDNPVLRFLPARDREYLMQAGISIRVDESRTGVKYLEAGAPSVRTALILQGSARAHTSSTSGLVATFEQGDLIGHEALTAANFELQKKEVKKPEKNDPIGQEPPPASMGDGQNKVISEAVLEERARQGEPLQRFNLREPDRITEVKLAPGTEVLEFNWYALRWTLEDNEAIWSRVKHVLSPDANAEVAPPRVVCVQGAHSTEELGSDLLAYGLAAALALDTGKKVYLIDIHGEENLTDWFGTGLLEESEAVVRSMVREWRQMRPDAPLEANSEARFKFKQVRQPIPVGRGMLHIRCPINPAENRDDVKSLVDFSCSEMECSYVVVSSRRRGKGANLDQSVAELARLLNIISHDVFYVTDDGDANYDFCLNGVEPSSLTWVYWMNSRYVTRERKRAVRERIDWGLKTLLFTPEEELRHLPVKQQVRVVPDELSASTFITALARSLYHSEPARDAGTNVPLESFLGSPPVDAHGVSRADTSTLAPEGARLPVLSPLARACRRMARVVERRTVGLALSGGGAWGFSHVALIHEMERTGVPIDYIAGASIGAIIGSIYASGGLSALDKLVDNNAARSWWDALAKDSLSRAVCFSMLNSLALERYIEDHIQEWTRSAGVPCLSITEIPFYPVGTDLMTHQSVFNLRTTMGWGVRMSGSFPPLVSSLPVGEHRLVDGAFSDNVPCRIVREVGAEFVIASNVVPSSPPGRHTSSPANSVEKGLNQVCRLLFGRMEDSIRGSFILGFIAGNDQGLLAANYRINLEAGDTQLFEMWKGPEIIRHTRKHLERKMRQAGGPILKLWAAFNHPATQVS